VVSITLLPPSTPGERAPGTYWKEGWVHPRAGLEVVDKSKISDAWDSKIEPLTSNLSVVQYVSGHCTDCATAAPVVTTQSSSP
jgi:hypothetical protein